MNGLTSADGVSRSINDRPATGGYVTAKADGWTSVREEVNPAWLRQGTNTVLFTVPSDAGYSYQVRNVALQTDNGNNGNGNGEEIVLASRPVRYGTVTYIHGFVRNGKAGSVRADGHALNVCGNEFEGIVPSAGDKVSVTTTADGRSKSRTFSLAAANVAEYNIRDIHAAGMAQGKTFCKGKADSLSVGGGMLAVTDVGLLKTAGLSVSVLRDVDIPALDFGMSNVTAEGEGYRFLPHGTHFTEDGATVRLKYDRTRIPSGYTEDDIRTYFFDRDTRHWVALERIRVDKESECVISRTTHFTDMINGVIQAPESPETDGFAPTMMNDIKAADPTAKLNVIAPPTANNRGSANMQYAFEMPPARNGMAPSLAIGYNSDGGNGWLGQGWDLSVPSITLDTRWGVPRYDLAKETETYLLSGSMLSTMGNDGQMGVAHRGEKMDRKADRQFYTRQGGDFSRIIRKGGSPSDYYWEVTDKQGVVYTYGGEGAVLKGTFTDAAGNTREVIAEWKLKKVVEPHGDYIEYVYETAEEPVREGLTAKAIYLTEVHAGNAGEEPHTVVTLAGNKEKRQKVNNARYGFLTSSNRLLEKVSVGFMGEELRSYAFSYTDGAFHKDLLEGVRQFDDQGQEFAFQEFDYYDDVQSKSGYVPFQSQTETWNTHDDGLDAGFINPLQAVSKRFSDKPTALGGTTSTSTSGSFYVGVGPTDFSQWKSSTAGGSYNYSSDNSKGLSAFVDLNGDGLPDKVYRKSGALYYRPQIRTSEPGEELYGDAVKVVGISNFATTKSTTNSGGGKAVVGWNALTAQLGVDVSKTKTKTTEYFSDINGDGLVDLVSNGKVYFNHIEFDGQGNSVPTFTLSSADTPSPIIYSGKIDASVITIDPEEQAEAIASSPMEDMVRVWEAPKPGIVNISGMVSLIVPSGDYDEQEYEKADGVRVAIQKGASELWSKTISKGDATAHNAMVQSVAVNKGDRFYFRVQSGNKETSNGAFDKVEWSPVITYTSAEEILPNGLSTVVYKPQDGAIYDVNTTVNVDNGNPFSLSGHFSKPQTTDDVVIRVMASNDRYDDNGNTNANYVEKEVYRAEYGWQDAADTDINAEIANADKLSNISFVIESTSNVDWTSVKWTPEITYNDSIGTSHTVSVGPHYLTYAKMDAEGAPKTFPAQDTLISVKPSVIFGSADVNGTATLLAKTQDRLIAKKTFAVTNGVFASDSLTIQNIGTDKVWFEITYPDILPSPVVSSSVSVRRGTSAVTETVDAGFYSYRQDEGFGMLYRGWGGFVYN